MAVADFPESSSAMMAGGDLDATLIRRLDEIAANTKGGGGPPHPVREIVLPLAVVLGLLANALMVGISWGRMGQRMDTIDQSQAHQAETLKSVNESLQNLRDRVHDLERDAKDDRKDFDALDLFTRGRIERLPWHMPGPRPPR